MTTWAPFVLAVFGVDLPKQNRSIGNISVLFSDGLLIIGIGIGLVGVLALVIYLWMRNGRKRRKHVSGGKRVYHESSNSPSTDKKNAARSVEEEDEFEDAKEDEDGTDGEKEPSPQDKRRYKYRVRRRTHRSRNPTLSETGGLPPVRAHEPGEPS